MLKGYSVSLLKIEQLGVLVVHELPPRGRNSSRMGRGTFRSMLDIENPWKKPTYTPSTVSEAHEPLPSPVTSIIIDCWDTYDWQNSSDALTNWINTRWKKTDFQVSKEVVCFTLRANGRDARMGLGDHLHGDLYRGPVQGK